jgi:N-acetylglucosaminyldiphosphoundecaprenol N-acetyl-beta-D-mannosaminyltransferase
LTRSAQSSAISIGALTVHPVTRAAALDAIEALVRSGEGGAVFTPNVDHVVLADEDARMRTAYARVSLSLADGMPLVWALRLLGHAVPEKVSGSDMVPAVLARAAERGWRVYFFGGGPGVASLARDKLREILPALQVVGVDAPRVDVDAPAEARADSLERIREVAPDLVLVALGAPKQEIWIDLVREQLRPAVLFGVGASLDFVAGTLPRAPRWMSQSGLEWLFRLAREPGRLWRRYLLRDPKFLLIVGRDLRGRAGPRVSRS